MKKLLLIGSNCIHTFNFFTLIKDYFKEIVLVTNTQHQFQDIKLISCYHVNPSLKNPLNYFKSIKSYKNILLKEKPDIIHIQQITTYSYLLIKALKKLNLNIPVVVTAWGSDILINPHKGFLYKKMVQYVLNNGNIFTADAQFLLDEMKKLTLRKIEVTVANFGINVENIPTKKENIIYSNRLHKSLYRIDKIIIAFAKFLQQYSDWKLVVAATGTETENLKRLCKTLEIESKVEFLGWVDAKTNSENYSKAKIWVSIPESDATSISLLEAMSLDCIPIVSCLPANKEWIEDAVNGLIIEDIDSNFLARFAEINCEKAIYKNKQIIAEKGTKEVNRNIFIKVYEQLLQ